MSTAEGFARCGMSKDNFHCTFGEHEEHVANCTLNAGEFGCVVDGRDLIDRTRCHPQSDPGNLLFDHSLQARLSCPTPICPPPSCPTPVCPEVSCPTPYYPNTSHRMTKVVDDSQDCPLILGFLALLAFTLIIMQICNPDGGSPRRFELNGEGNVEKNGRNVMRSTAESSDAQRLSVGPPQSGSVASEERHLVAELPGSEVPVPESRIDEVEQVETPAGELKHAEIPQLASSVVKTGLAETLGSQTPGSTILMNRALCEEPSSIESPTTGLFTNGPFTAEPSSIVEPSSIEPPSTGLFTNGPFTAEPSSIETISSDTSEAESGDSDSSVDEDLAGVATPDSKAASTHDEKRPDSVFKTDIRPLDHDTKKGRCRKSCYSCAVHRARHGKRR